LNQFFPTLRSVNTATRGICLSVGKIKSKINLDMFSYTHIEGYRVNGSTFIVPHNWVSIISS